ncbi:hypothetical protein QFZ72_002555 [Bacillus sp. V2I10]|nr:hypothetical protein [Bacillus sp. V2I10]
MHIHFQYPALFGAYPVIFEATPILPPTRCNDITADKKGSRMKLEKA